ncbi:MAG: hypothetical protein JWM93_1029 [Frankiales bacterium]|nr:hypothetical protein [Frankiales bacterium]
MGGRLRVDTVALRGGAGLVRDCARDVDDAHLSLADAAAAVPWAIDGSRTADAWHAVTHLVAAVGAEAHQLDQLATGLTDVAATIELRDKRLGEAAAALSLTAEQV